MTTTFHTTLMCTIIAAAGLGCGAGTPAAPDDGSPAAQPAAARQADPPAVPKTRSLPTATLPDGFVITLELAVSPEEVAQGLMFRTAMADDRGMLFLFEHERFPSFWMKNTFIPLDIVFLDAQGAVVDVAHDAQPCKAEPCPQYIAKTISSAVLELNAGSARDHGLVEGAQVTFSRVPGYPRPALD